MQEHYSDRGNADLDSDYKNLTSDEIVNLNNDAFKICNETGRTLLHLAATDGNIEMINRAKAVGADFNIIREDHAVGTDKNGKEYSTSTIGITPLFDAIRTKQSAEFIANLIKAGADVNSKLTFTSNINVTEESPNPAISSTTPLHFVAESGNVELFRLLLENGAKAHELNGEKQTPLASTVELGKMSSYSEAGKVAATSAEIQKILNEKLAKNIQKFCDNILEDANISKLRNEAKEAAKNLVRAGGTFVVTNSNKPSLHANNLFFNELREINPEADKTPAGSLLLKGRTSSGSNFGPRNSISPQKQTLPF